MLSDAAALILAGGQSRRMGRDKAALRLEGQTLLERQAAFWTELCPQVLVAVGTPDRLPDAPGLRVFDAVPGCGPLGGLAAGLEAARPPLLFVSAVDMPFLTRASALALYDAIADADACVWRRDGRPEPLLGLYRQSCLAPARSLLAAGTYKMGLLLRQVTTRYLDAQCGDFLQNWNFPEDVPG